MSLRRPPSARGAAHVAALALLVAACKSTPPPLPPGPGLVAEDRRAPSGVEVAPRPTWSEGDTFEFLHGGELRVRYRVERAADGWRLVDQDERRAIALDDDLRQLGELDADGAWTARLDPLDPSLSWPLWEGKRWSGAFVARGRRGPGTPLLVEHHCGAPETITVPAGTFRAWPIWRTHSLAGSTTALDRTAILWYAPDVGWYVRRLEGGVLAELTAYHRQSPGDDAGTLADAPRAP